MIFSHSKLGCFENCPRKYKYKYVDRVEVPYFETIEAFMGKRVHEALEHLYEFRMRGKVLGLEEVLKRYSELWERHWTPDVVITKDDMTADDYRSLGSTCLADYYIRYHPFDQGRVLEGLD